MIKKQSSHSYSIKQPLHHSPKLQGQTHVDKQWEGYCEMLAEPNPIRKREKLQPRSIFELLPLPDFQYPADKGELEPTFHGTKNQTERNINSWTNREISLELKLPSTQMSEIFQNPIYRFNERVQCSTNQNIGCIQANYWESKECQLQEITQLQRDVLQEQNQLFSLPIKFQSRFQSGNLAVAAKGLQLNSYNLAVCRDINTSKCTQWFFFRTTNTVPQTCTFRILNFIKPYSIFENGMKICVASLRDGYVWRRECEGIKYQKTNVPIHSHKKMKMSGSYYYALSFCYTFKHPQDTVYFAYCYPYTYTMLENFLSNLSEKHENKTMKRRKIAQSPGGNCVELITVTNMNKTHAEEEANKKVVVITSRVHPGETPSSFVCEGILRYLLGTTAEAGELRDHFVFKIVPMLNPDGVINGSYRCNLSGYDLNRVWHQPCKLSHPEIYGAKKIIAQIAQKYKIFMFVDLHAHSKKKGVFMYGCQKKENPYLCRHIPFLLCKNIPQFNYYQCNFSLNRGRQGTSRLHHCHSLQIDYSYTMEHSFCGPSQSKTHFSRDMYIKIGQNFVLTLNKYFTRPIKGGKNLSSLKDFKELYTDKCMLEVGSNENAESSSDEQLDQEKAPPAIENKPVRGTVSRGSIPRVRKDADKIKIPSKTSMKIGRIENDSCSKTQEVSIRRYSLDKKQLPSVAMLFKQKAGDTDARQVGMQVQPMEQICFSSLADQLDQLSQTQKPQILQHYRKLPRYHQQRDQIVSLSDLFLPSIKNASYRKYNRKEQIKNLPANRTLIEDAIQKKQQLRPFQKRKYVNNWRDQTKSFK